MTPKPAPADPFGQLVEAGTAIHEMFRSYVVAGFTEPQALYLVGSLLAAQVRNQNLPPDNG